MKKYEQTYSSLKLEAMEYKNLKPKTLKDRLKYYFFAPLLVTLGFWLITVLVFILF